MLQNQKKKKNLIPRCINLNLTQPELDHPLQKKCILCLNSCYDEQVITVTMVKYQINHLKIHNYYCTGI